MIREFIETWDLFKYSYLEGWLIAVLLSTIGVIVVARDQIFIGAAVSQASTVGIALALCVASLVPLHEHSPSDSLMDNWLHSDSFQSFMAIAFSVAAALLTARGSRLRGESHEVLTGWVFLLSASLSVLIVAHSPHGLEEIHRLHSSSLIGATREDVLVFVVMALLTIAVIVIAHRPLLLIVTDAGMAASVGLSVTTWSLVIALWMGLSVGLSIQSSGILYSFGMLVLPAVVAKNLCREVRPMFWVSPICGLTTAAAGFVLANHFDFPPAQMAIVILCVLLLITWVVTHARYGFGRF